MPEEAQNTGTTTKKRSPHPNLYRASCIKRDVVSAIANAKRFRKTTKETAVVLNELASALQAINSVLATCGDVEAYRQ